MVRGNPAPLWSFGTDPRFREGKEGDSRPMIEQELASVQFAQDNASHLWLRYQRAMIGKRSLFPRSTMPYTMEGMVC